MSPDNLELLFGGQPRPPFGLHAETGIAEVQAHLYEIPQLVAERAITEATYLLDKRGVSIDERHTIASCIKILFEDLTSMIKGAGTPAKSGTPVMHRWITLEVIDDPTMIARLAARYGRLTSARGFSVHESQKLRESLETAFTHELFVSGSLPRLATLE